MKARYFAECRTIEQLKSEYRRLAKINHPDAGGSTEVMQEINATYDRLFKVLQHEHNAKAENVNRQNTEQPETFRDIINALIHLEGLIIEICGSWLWLSGNTFQYKLLIKELGFKWASQKKMWYLGEMNKTSRKTMSMEHIRAKYGSEIYMSESRLQLV